MEEAFRFVLSKGCFPLLEDLEAVSVWEAAIGGRNRLNSEILHLVLETIRDGNGEYHDAIHPVTHLFRLGSKSNEAILTAMLSDRHLDFNKADETGQTLLHKAILHDNEGVGQLLLESGADINARDGDGRTALYYAAENQDSKAVQMLLEASAKILTRKILRKSPLTACLFSDCLFMSQGWTPIDEFLTIMRDIIQQLVKYGADPNQSYQRRAIIHEILNNQALAHSVHAVQILLDLAAEPDMIDRHGMSPLHYAALSGDIRTVPRLLVGGADLNAKNKRGMTLAQLAERPG
ncbi:ankyrin repeat-containing domain protein [Aspergillus pseudoustus]|uniref:Ankyrin repeat-containing domain protein n=1 Tax=Aspergillus pseudoustus TaxID=1810923 RepID=A0ABR4JIU0_9EURO